MGSGLLSSQSVVRLHAILIIVLSLFANTTYAQGFYQKTRPRIVITADPELDDNNSLIRLLLYSCDHDIEGTYLCQQRLSTGKETERELNGLFPAENIHVLG